MALAQTPTGDVSEMPLDDLSAAVRISKQTIVTWADRGLIEATLDWGVGGGNSAVRLIRLGTQALDFVRSFAADYRDDTVSRTEARRLLKLIDRNQVQRLVRQGRVNTRRVEGETRIDVGSVEDYLMTLETPGAPAD